MRKGWELKKLGEVCNFVRGPFGGSLKKNCFKKDGYAVYEQQHAIHGVFNFRYFIDEQKFQEMKRFEVFPNDILMSCSGTMGKISIVPNNAPKGIINQALLKLTVTHFLLNTFLKYWMESDVFQEELTKYSKGAAIQNVASVKILKDIHINLPPLSEQQRIVKILDNAFAKIDMIKQNAERNLQNAKELFKSVLKFEISIEKGWEIKTLAQISENLDSKRIPITQNKRENGKYPYYGASGIVDYISDYIFDEDLLLISEDGANLLARTYPIAFSVTGKIWVNNHAHVIKFHNLITQKYIEYFFASIKLDKYVSGMAQPKLNQKALNSIPIPYPLLLEQKEIVTKLDILSTKCQKLENNYRQIIDNCDQLKQTILKKAFNGEL